MAVKNDDVLSLKQGSANFSVKDQTVNVFAGSVVSSQLLSSAIVAGKQP